MSWKYRRFRITRLLHISKQGEEKVLYTENDRKNIKRKRLFQTLDKAIDVVQTRQDLVQQKAMLDEEIVKADQEIYCYICIWML